MKIILKIYQNRSTSELSTLSTCTMNLKLEELLFVTKTVIGSSGTDGISGHKFYRRRPYAYVTLLFHIFTFVRQ